MTKNLDFYFDFLSPYSYFGWQSHQNSNLIDANFRYIPVLMGKLFDHHQIKGPALVKPKREYMLRFCFRYAHKNHISFCPPKTHPFNPLYSLRLATSECSGDNQFKVIDLLFSAAWSKKQIDLSNPDEIEKLLNDSGLNGSELIERSSSKEVRSALKSNIKLAIENEVFGVPTFKVENELFWGNDSIPDLKNFLQEQDQYDKEIYQKALSLNPLL